MDDSAMIVRIKFKTPPGEQFIVRREVYKLIQESFKEHGIEFAYRNVTFYLPSEVTGTESTEAHEEGAASGRKPDGKIIGASAAAAFAASQVDETGKKPEK